MTVTTDVCPSCGRAFKRKKGVLLPAVIGSVAGFFMGLAFVGYWFGTAGGFTHPMAVIHEAAGALLGLLAGLIVGALRRLRG
jgi:hypothetical protein